MNSYMFTNKVMCKIKQSILYLTFSSSEFIDTVLVVFFDRVFAIFIDSIADTLFMMLLIIS